MKREVKAPQDKATGVRNLVGGGRGLLCCSVEKFLECDFFFGFDQVHGLLGR